MGSVEIKYDRENDLTVLTASGTLKNDDFENAANSYLSDGPTRRVLWDLSSATSTGLSADVIRGTFERISTHPSSRIDRRVAFVVSRKLGYGLSRLASAYAKIAGINADYLVTYDRDEALEWLFGDQELVLPGPGFMP